MALDLSMGRAMEAPFRRKFDDRPACFIHGDGRQKIGERVVHLNRTPVLRRNARCVSPASNWLPRLPERLPTLNLALLVQTDYRTEQNRSSRCTTSSTGTLIKDECSPTNHIEQLFAYI